MDRPIDLGSLEPGREASTTFLCYSATRDLDVNSASDDPLLKVKVTPLTATERAKLEEFPPDLKDDKHKLNPRKWRTVRSAFKIEVRLYESQGGRQLDMGQLLRQTPLTITDW